MTFSSPFSHWRYSKAPTSSELKVGSLLLQLIGKDLTRVIYGCCRGGMLSLFKEPSVFFQTKPPSISTGAQALRMRPNCRGWRPDVHHSAALLLAHSPASLISHYTVTVVASLSTHCVMYGLAEQEIQKP